MESGNTEIRFLAALLRTTSQEQDAFYAKQIPLGVFKTHSREMLWVQKYREKYGCYPSAVAAQIHFGERLPKHSDPVEACLQPILDLSMYQDMSQVNQRVKDMLDAGEPIADAMAVFKMGAAKLRDFSVDYVDSNFSRSSGTRIRYRELVKMRSNPKNVLVDFPWPSLNKLIFSVRPGNTIIFASRTSLGKSWCAINWAHYLAMKGISVLFVTKEMPTEEIEDRFEAHHFKLPYSAFRRGELPPKVLRRWYDARKHDVVMPLTICGDETLEGTGLDHVVGKIEQYRPKVVVIDGAYLLQVKGMPKNANKVEKLAFLSSRVKVIAKVTKTIIMAVLQLNRTAEDKQGNTKGGITSIYGADTWAQDSDYVVTLNGQRGSTSRMISLDKGRESNIGEFNIGFQLDPYPFFAEKHSTQTSSKFKGIK